MYKKTKTRNFERGGSQPSQGREMRKLKFTWFVWLKMCYFPLRSTDTTQSFSPNSRQRLLTSPFWRGGGVVEGGGEGVGGGLVWRVRVVNFQIHVYCSKKKTHNSAVCGLCSIFLYSSLIHWKWNLEVGHFYNSIKKDQDYSKISFHEHSHFRLYRQCHLISCDHIWHHSLASHFWA